MRSSRATENVPYFERDGNRIEYHPDLGVVRVFQNKMSGRIWVGEFDLMVSQFVVEQDNHNEDVCMVYNHGNYITYVSCTDPGPVCSMLMYFKEAHMMRVQREYAERRAQEAYEKAVEQLYLELRRSRNELYKLVPGYNDPGKR